MLTHESTIRQRLTRFAILTVSVACLIIASLEIAGKFLEEQEKMYQNVRVLMEVTTETVKPHLAFQDAASAKVAMHGLIHRPDLLGARLIMPSGAVLAEVSQEKTSGQSTPERPTHAISIDEDEEEWLLGQSVLLSHTITHDGEVLGTLEMHMDLRESWHGQGLHLLWILAALGVSLLVARYIARRLEADILRPITDLERAVHDITVSRQYDLRVTRTTDDELGNLVDRFNTMLAEIEKADNELKQHRDLLEAQVNERTRHLRQAMAHAEQEKDTATRANAAKSEFLSRMSHELRTPLNAIMGFGQLLAMPDTPALSPTQQGYVEEILNASDQLLNQINEVLDLARIESGKLTLSMEPVGLSGLIQACISQLRPLCDQQALQIHCNIPTPLAVQADHHRTTQVVLNLLSNAIKYNRPGGDIDITAQMLDNGEVRVSVRDNGRGIAPEHLARLFKPFERLESSYDGIEGAGIGLSLVKMLVEAMNGRIGVESELGAGSTFWFVLQGATLPSIPARPQPVTLPATANAATPTTHQHHVLYVEDNPANLKLMQKILAQHPDIQL